MTTILIANQSKKQQHQQRCFQLNQMNVTKQHERDYLVHCDDVPLKINTLQSLFNWYKLKATEKYEDVEKKPK
ncbi:unnamed protein product [Schistosoma curassoni]|uniref:Dynein regulatory complex subunit 7 C-terminal domain-containing protein n=1 Tax=Schistosoma curassoni TaxID=6186 RepID=A0A183JRA1_9TREM|nr:unnamed protein product [Schistosoma curassoni]